MNPGHRQVALECIASSTRELPDSVVEAVAAELEAMPDSTLSEHRVDTLIKGIPGSAHRLQLKMLFRCLAETGVALSPSALAWALRGAAAQDTGYRARERIDFVWTGPQTPVLTPRRSDGALVEVIDRSTRELYVATFAAYRVPALKKALSRAVERGVTVRLILESTTTSGGKVGFDPLHALKPNLPMQIEVYAWPNDKRPSDDLGRRGSLHMKCAVADAELVLVSSANLTEFAFDLNMELGVLIRSETLGRQLTHHFESLIHQRILQEQADPDS